MLHTSKKLVKISGRESGLMIQVHMRFLTMIIMFFSRFYIYFSKHFGMQDPGQVVPSALQVCMLVSQASETSKRLSIMFSTIILSIKEKTVKNAQYKFPEASSHSMLHPTNSPILICS